jgi:transcriptional regulator with XRE-family HTH domain
MTRQSGKRRVYRATFIREFREKLGLTLVEVAKKCGTTHATLSRLERGLIPYSQRLLEKIALVLCTTPGRLIDGPVNDTTF